MNISTKNKQNFILIPKWLCHKRDWHRWYWTARNRSFISAQCSRCGMRGTEFWKLQDEDNAKARKKLMKKRLRRK